MPTLVLHHFPSFAHPLDLDLTRLLLSVDISLFLSAAFDCWISLSLLIRLSPALAFALSANLVLTIALVSIFHPPSYPLSFLPVPFGMSHFALRYFLKPGAPISVSCLPLLLANNHSSRPDPLRWQASMTEFRSRNLVQQFVSSASLDK